jgi:phosphoribosylglycinamide formyltransferase-1
MAAIAEACAAGRIGARIVSVIADREGAAGIERARARGIPTEVVPYAAYSERAAFDARLREVIEASGATLVALAGFMRILTPGFVEAFAGRLLNVHPSLLPKFRGLDTHARALAARETEHGASIHYVTAELDGGPVIHQGRVRVVPGDTAVQLAARVQFCEHVIYPRVIGWIAAGRLRWNDGPVLDGRALRAPIVEDFDAP